MPTVEQSFSSALLVLTDGHRPCAAPVGQKVSPRRQRLSGNLCDLGANGNTFVSVPVQAALLTGIIGVAGSGSVGGVRPLALDLPLRPIAERHQRYVEGPRAFVAVLLALTVVPRAWTIGITPRLRQFMPAHVG